MLLFKDVFSERFVRHWKTHAPMANSGDQSKGSIFSFMQFVWKIGQIIVHSLILDPPLAHKASMTWSAEELRRKRKTRNTKTGQFLLSVEIILQALGKYLVVQYGHLSYPGQLGPYKLKYLDVLKSTKSCHPNRATWTRTKTRLNPGFPIGNGAPTLQEGRHPII